MSSSPDHDRTDHTPLSSRRLAARALEQLCLGAERDARAMNAAAGARASFQVVREPDVFLVVRHDSVGCPVAAVRFERTGERITITVEGSPPYSVGVRPNDAGDCDYVFDGRDKGASGVQLRSQALALLFSDGIL